MATVRFHKIFVPQADLPTRPDDAVLRSVQRAFPGTRVQLREARQNLAGRHIVFRIIGEDHARPRARTRQRAHHQHPLGLPT